MMGPNSDGGGGDGESRENRRKFGLFPHLLHPFEIGCCSLMIAMEVDS